MNLLGKCICIKKKENNVYLKTQVIRFYEKTKYAGNRYLHKQFKNEIENCQGSSTVWCNSVKLE